MILKSTGRDVSMDVEYGAIQTQTLSYLAEVTYDECDRSRDTAMRIIAARFDETWPKVSIRFEADLPASETMVYSVTATKMNYALREDNLYWSTTTRGTLSMEQSSQIYQYPLLAGPGTQPDLVCTVSYGDDVQVASFQKYVPVAELSCMGIFRQTQTPAWLHDNFLGVINSAAFRGYGNYIVMCSAADTEPFDVGRRGVEPRYKISFRFQIKPDGWGPWVYYTDPETGYPPADVVYGIGYGKLDPPLLGSPYRFADFNNIWPFSEESE